MSIWPLVYRICSTRRNLTSMSPVESNGWIQALHVFVLFNFALSQPLYDLLGQHAAFLIHEQIGLQSLFLMAFILSAALPATVVLVECFARRFRPQWNGLFHTLVVFTFVLLFTLPLMHRVLFFSAFISICTALVVTGAVTWSYSVFQQARSIFTVASPGIVLFPTLFLFFSPVARLNGDPCTTPTEQFDPVPVVLLVCDEFCGSSLMTPERAIDENRFPNFAALSRQTTWFRNASSVNQDTHRALPAILSGRYPSTGRVPVPADVPQNLFRVLDRTYGYRHAIFEPVSALAPLDANRVHSGSNGSWGKMGRLLDALWRVYLFQISPDSFHLHLPHIPRSWFGMHDSKTVNRHQKRGVFQYSWGEHRDAQFQHFLDTIDGSSDPTLHFMHVLLPHMPWCYLPTGHRHSEDGSEWNLLEMATQGDTIGQWGHDELEVIHFQQRYLLQLMYVDRLIGQLISRLKETGMYDRCLLIVTGDHGISFRPGLPRRRMVPENEDEIAAIPFFIKRPGQTVGQVSEQAVESVDILPTIADVVGLNLLQPIDGSSVFEPSRGNRKQSKFGDTDGLTTIETSRIVNSKTPLELRQRFGDSSDPHSFYRVGPMPDLVGRSLTELDHSGSDAVEIELTRFHDAVSNLPGSEVPCLFEGRIRSPKPVDSPVILAVAVNGTIQAVSRTYLRGEYRNQWAALVAENSFHAGKNNVLFFSVTGTSPDWRLSPCVTSHGTK